MKKTSKFARFFKFFWLSKDKINPVWDELLNHLIDKGNVTHVDEYTMTFDDEYVVWIENHPYSSGQLTGKKSTGTFGFGDFEKYQVSKDTKIRLEDFYYSYMESIKKPEPLLEDLEKYKNQ